VLRNHTILDQENEIRHDHMSVSANFSLDDSAQELSVAGNHADVSESGAGSHADVAASESGAGSDVAAPASESGAVAASGSPTLVSSRARTSLCPTHGALPTTSSPGTMFPSRSDSPGPRTDDGGPRSSGLSHADLERSPVSSRYFVMPLLRFRPNQFSAFVLGLRVVYFRRKIFRLILFDGVIFVL
jgi:hypothetical protein